MQRMVTLSLEYGDLQPIEVHCKNSTVIYLCPICKQMNKDEDLSVEGGIYSCCNKHQIKESELKQGVPIDAKWSDEW